MTTSFTDLGVPADLAAVLARKGIEAPFPIQEYTIPDALQGLDVTGRAPTGSGKTIAFGLAVAAQVKPAKPKRPTALILAPTRELAEQSARVLLARARRYAWLQVRCRLRRHRLRRAAERASPRC